MPSDAETRLVPPRCLGLGHIPLPQSLRHHDKHRAATDAAPRGNHV